MCKNFITVNQLLKYKDLYVKLEYKALKLPSYVNKLKIIQPSQAKNNRLHMCKISMLRKKK